MGSLSRLLSALGGLFLLLLVFSLFLLPAADTLADPEHADFPGGASGIVAMLLLMASVPTTGAVLLLRRAPVVSPTQADTFATHWPARSAPAELIAAAAMTAVETSPTSVEPTSRETARASHLHDKPPLLRRLRPVAAHLLTTSVGRGLIAAIATVALTTGWREAAPAIGPMARTLFSVIDPLLIASHPRWWRSAFVSGAVWFVLYLVTAAVALGSRQPDASRSASSCRSWRIRRRWQRSA